MPESIDNAITIREIRHEDEETVAHLTTQLGYTRDAGEIAAWIDQLGRENADQTAFVACLKDEVVGWIEVSIERRLQSAPFGMIGGLVVSDRVRNRKIGWRLCQRAEEWTREKGLGVLRVTSRSTREDAHRFYLRDRYREVKTSLVFEKQLGAKAERP